MPPEFDPDCMSRCAYIFLDEAGNFDFNVNGTRYFALASVSMRRPFLAFDALDNYKHDCLEAGRNLEYFHCSHDREEVRNGLFDLIAAHLDGIRIDYLVVQKSGTDPPLQEAVRFCPEMLGHLLKVVLPRELDADSSEVIIITDAIPVNRKRRAVEKAVRTTLARMLPPGMNYRVLHHQSRSHYGLQVADYSCWAVFRKWLGSGREGRALGTTVSSRRCATSSRFEAVEWQVRADGRQVKKATPPTTPFLESAHLERLSSGGDL